MKKIELREDYIKSLPLTTNRITVDWSVDKFFNRYSIISYYTNDPKFKNLAYEQLGDVPSISVSGIFARWDTNHSSYIKFFILAKKENERKVLNSLRAYESIKSFVDTLVEYDEIIKKRIIASLAINSLGKKKSDKMMYHNGSLLVSDEKNFNAKKSRRELVCLKITVNEYMILTASTTSFSNPVNVNELRKHKNCVLQIVGNIEGDFWSGQTLKPIIIRDCKNGEYDLNRLFIQKKAFQDNKNIVPYWPYNPENYFHGKLYVIWQVLHNANKAFKGLVNMSFADFPVLHYDEQLTGDGMVKLMKTFFLGKTLSFEDPFNTNNSKELITQIKAEIKNIIGDTPSFPKKPSSNDMIIKLCEPKAKDRKETLYTQSLKRFLHTGNALQHVVFEVDKTNVSIDTASVRRILIELLVKESLALQRIPPILSEIMQGWCFLRYKINIGNVHGASLSVDSKGIMSIFQYGLSQNNQGMDFEDFVAEELNYNSPEKIRGAKDYMALKKDGNVYLIIDTDEIPILDVTEIDEGYNQVVNNGETVAMFKRKASVHKYLRGYIGFHLWKSDGIDGEPNDSYSYISGNNKENLKITDTTKMDKMPRARRIFVLHKENPDIIESHIAEISNMLKFGFGRWNELMTYPFPFKFLLEYLDDATETAFCKHWSEITHNGIL